MNIEIGNTTQTFELGDEIIWHLKKKTRFKIISFFRKRLRFFIIYRGPYSKNQSSDYYQFYWGVFRILGTYYFFSRSSFLNWRFRYPRWWSQWHSSLSFFWFIGVDINNVTCVGINTRTGPCTGSDNYAELRKLYQRLTYAWHPVLG